MTCVRLNWLNVLLPRIHFLEIAFHGVCIVGDEERGEEDMAEGLSKLPVGKKHRITGLYLSIAT